MSVILQLLSYHKRVEVNHIGDMSPNGENLQALQPTQATSGGAI